MAQGGMQDPPCTAAVVVRWVKAVCFLHWQLIKHPSGGCAAEENTKNKLLPTAMENWAQASRSLFPKHHC